MTSWWTDFRTSGIADWHIAAGAGTLAVVPQGVVSPNALHLTGGGQGDCMVEWLLPPADASQDQEVLALLSMPRGPSGTTGGATHSGAAFLRRSDATHLFKAPLGIANDNSTRRMYPCRFDGGAAFGPSSPTQNFPWKDNTPYWFKIQLKPGMIVNWKVWEYGTVEPADAVHMTLAMTATSVAAAVNPSTADKWPDPAGRAGFSGGGSAFTDVLCHYIAVAYNEPAPMPVPGSDQWVNVAGVWKELVAPVPLPPSSTVGADDFATKWSKGGGAASFAADPTITHDVAPVGKGTLNAAAGGIAFLTARSTVKEGQRFTWQFWAMSLTGRTVFARFQTFTTDVGGGGGGGIQHDGPHVALRPGVWTLVSVTATIEAGRGWAGTNAMADAGADGDVVYISGAALHPGEPVESSTPAWVNVGGVWKAAEQGWANVAGVWKKLWPKPDPPLPIVPVTATGGTASTLTEGTDKYEARIFDTSGTFQFTSPAELDVEVVAVAGGASGGDGPSGGIGGGGGQGERFALRLKANTPYSFTVGAGGQTPGPGAGNPGQPTTAFGKTFAGGLPGVAGFNTRMKFELTTTVGFGVPGTSHVNPGTGVISRSKPYSGSGGDGSADAHWGAPGRGGCVIVRYKVP